MDIMLLFGIDIKISLNSSTFSSQEQGSKTFSYSLVKGVILGSTGSSGYNLSGQCCSLKVKSDSSSDNNTERSGYSFLKMGVSKCAFTPVSGAETGVWTFSEDGAPVCSIGLLRGTVSVGGMFFPNKSPVILPLTVPSLRSYPSTIAASFSSCKIFAPSSAPVELWSGELLGFPGVFRS